MTACRSRSQVAPWWAMLMLLAALSGTAAADPPVSTAAPEPDVPGAPDAQHGRVLYLRHCIACHGARAWGDGPREIPSLAGQRAPYLIGQLRRFASGARAGSPMHGAAMRDTLSAADVNRPAAIADLAAYLGDLPAAAQPDQGEGRSLAQGRAAYLGACAGCHGADGTGAEPGAVPRIGGQHFRYLLSRLRELDAVHGTRLAAASFSADEQQALADFISRLPPRGPPPAIPQ